MKIRQFPQAIITNLFNSIELHKSSFPWEIDTERLNLEVKYNSKTLIPLICRSCKNNISHSPSNIFHTLKNPGHINCRECKKLNYSKEKIAKSTSGEFELITIRTNEGFKIIHSKCNKYFYSTNPNTIKTFICPFCKNPEINRPLIGKMRDKEQIKEFLEHSSKGKVEILSYCFDTKLISLKCKKHNTHRTLSYNQFLISKNRSKNFGCRECKLQQIRHRSFQQYNDLIFDKGLFLKNFNAGEKICSKTKVLHYCIIKSYHPPMLASPYEVEFKNKRCPFCFDLVSFHKDFNYIKQYVEMDEERILTHGGTFKLLTTKGEFDELINRKGNVSKLSLKIKQIQCDLHSSFNISWRHFKDRKSGCTSCSKERGVSFAHSYFQALCSYFQIEYVPEFEINVKNKSLRIDFYFPIIDLYVEIDSIIHNYTNDTKNKFSHKEYIERDNKKNILLAEKLHRINIYDKDKNSEIPINLQLNKIDIFFKKLFLLSKDVELDNSEIIQARKDDDFFRNSRIARVINKVKYFHDNHLEVVYLNHLSLAIDIYNNQPIKFKCFASGEEFEKVIPTVTSFDFLCPVCVKNFRNGKIKNFGFSLDKIKKIDKNLVHLHQGEFYIKDIEQFNNTVVNFRTARFCFIQKSTADKVYFPLYLVFQKSTAQLIKILKSLEFKRTHVIHKRHEKKAAILIDSIPTHDRTILNEKSVLDLENYNNRCISINKKLRIKGGDLNGLIEENELSLQKFVHASDTQARMCIGKYDREIVPYFEKSPFKLLTPREKYGNNRQMLLVRSINCGHLFYVSWLWKKVKEKKDDEINCYHKDCWSIYYNSKYNPGNKIANIKILEQFKLLFLGMYFPVCPEEEIKVREPIFIQHLPSKSIIKSSFDNFRRGKFSHPYKKYSIDQLKIGFPDFFTSVL